MRTGNAGASQAPPRHPFPVLSSSVAVLHGVSCPGAAARAQVTWRLADDGTTHGRRGPALAMSCVQRFASSRRPAGVVGRQLPARAAVQTVAVLRLDGAVEGPGLERTGSRLQGSVSRAVRRSAYLSLQAFSPQDFHSVRRYPSTSPSPRSQGACSL